MRPTYLLLAALLALFPQAASGADGFDLSQTSAAEKPVVSWHGYYEFEYLDDDQSRPTFDLHKITLWMGAKINDIASVSSEIEYEHAPDLSGSGGVGTIKVDSAQLRLTPTDYLAISAGLFYVPFGIEFESYPGHKNRLVTRPRVMKSGGVIPGTWSDVGVAASVTADNIGAIDLFGVNGDARNGGVSRDSKGGGNEGKSLGARLSLNRLVEGLNLGGSYVAGAWDEESQRLSTRAGAHLVVAFDQIFDHPALPQIIAEYVTGVDEGDSSLEAEDREVAGYYLQLAIRPIPLLGAAIRYGVWDNDRSLDDNGATESSAGVAFHPYERIQLKAEYRITTFDEPGKDDHTLVALQLATHW